MEAELVLTLILTEICRQEPEAWLTSLRERLNFIAVAEFKRPRQRQKSD